MSNAPDSSSQFSPENAPSVDPLSVEGIFVNALALKSTAARQEYLNRICEENSEQRQKVELLLRAYDDAGSFLERPVADVKAALAPETITLEFLTRSADPGLMGTLGAYEVYEIIGRGGMGIVFRARDPKLNRVVAIKVMAPELAANPNARRRFIREAQAAAAISHPHVVTIHAVDDDEKIPYLVMECIVGQSLQQKLDKVGALRLTEILRISKQIAEGLSAAHKQGLIHRDIKPANILLENGVERVKITDFGLARAVDDVSVTRTGEVAGTPQFMSPEQAKGERVDHRSDLFSLGCVMYAMCTGRSPFRATSFAASIHRVVNDTPRPIGEINQELPQWLVGIINQLLEKEADDRIQTAGELVEVLEEYLADVQAPATPRRTPPRPTGQPSAKAAASKSQSSAGSNPVIPAGQEWGGWLRFLRLGGLLSVVTAVLVFGLVQVFNVGMSDILVFGCFWLFFGGIMAMLVGSVSKTTGISSEGVLILLVLLLGPLGVVIWFLGKDRWASTDSTTAANHEQEPTVSSDSVSGHQFTISAPLLAMLANSYKWAGLLTALLTAAMMLFFAAQPELLTHELRDELPGYAFVLLVLSAVVGWIGSRVQNTEWGFETYLSGRVAAVLVLFLIPVTPFAVPLSLLTFWLSGTRDMQALLGPQAESQNPKQPLRRPERLLDLGVVIGSAAITLAISYLLGCFPSAGPGDAENLYVIALPVVLLNVVVRGRLFQGRIWRDAGWSVGAVCATASCLMMESWFDSMEFRGQNIALPLWILVNLWVFGVPLAFAGWFIWRMFTPEASGELETAQPVNIPRRALTTLLCGLGAVTVLACLFLTLSYLRLRLDAATGSLTIHPPAGEHITHVTMDGQRLQATALTSLGAWNIQRLPQGVHQFEVQRNGQSPWTMSLNIVAGHQEYQFPTDYTGVDPGAGNEGMSAMKLPPARQQQGGLIVRIRDEGLSVRLVPYHADGMMSEGMDSYGAMSSTMMMAGEDAGFGSEGYPGNPYGFSPLVPGSQQYPAGTYVPQVTDELYGWQLPENGADTMGMAPGTNMMSGMEGYSSATSVTYHLAPITINAGEFTTLNVARNLVTVFESPPRWEAGKFYELLWAGKRFTLSSSQAKVVQRLAELAGQPGSVRSATEAELQLLLSPALPDRLASEEFFALCDANPETFLRTAFFCIVGRSPNSAEWTIWQDRLKDPAWTRQRIVDLLIQKSGQAAATDPSIPKSSLEELFNGGQHPAWGTLIHRVPEASTTSYTLTEAPSLRETLINDVFSSGGNDGLLNSEEAHRDFVSELHQRVLGRLPFPEEAVYWHERLRALGDKASLLDEYMTATGNYQASESNVLLQDQQQADSAVEVASAIKTEMMALKLQRARLLQTRSAQHPEVVELDRLIESLNHDLGLLPSAVPGSESVAAKRVHSASFVVSDATQRRAALGINLRDPQMRVVLRQKSAFDGTASAEEVVLDTWGRVNNHVYLTPGDYELLIERRWLGWGRQIKSITLGNQQQAELEFSCDLQELAEISESEIKPDPDYAFYWNNQRHSLTEKNEFAPAFIEVMRLLLKSYTSEPEGIDVPLSYHNVTLNLPPEIFHTDEETGKARLVRLNTASLTIRLDGHHCGAELKATTQQGSRPVHETTTLTLPAGTYQLRRYNSNVFWINAPGEEVTLTAGESKEIVVDDSLHWHIGPVFANVAVPTPHNCSMVWGPSSVHGFGQHYFTHEQAIVVSRLLKGLSEQKFELPETELITDLTLHDQPVMQLKQIFPELGEPGTLYATSPLLGSDSGAVSVPIGWIIIPGLVEGTYRLRPWPQGTIPEEEHAAQFGREPKAE